MNLYILHSAFYNKLTALNALLHCLPSFTQNRGHYWIPKYKSRPNCYERRLESSTHNILSENSQKWFFKITDCIFSTSLRFLLYEDTTLISVAFIGSNMHPLFEAVFGHWDTAKKCLLYLLNWFEFPFFLKYKCTLQKKWKTVSFSLLNRDTLVEL